MPQPTIHTYAAAERGLFVNSYLIETSDGVVVVDSNLLLPDVAALKARLAALGKPLRAVFVTHAHPDHFNGVAELLRDREVPVYATAEVARVIREIADAKRAQWGPMYGDDWPSETYYPNTELSDGEKVVIDGVTVSVRAVGRAESHADSYLLVSADGGRPAAFIGDLAFNHTHPYTADGHTAGWLAALDRLAVELSGVSRLLPGHGAPASPAVLTEQRQYLLHYREVVGRLAAGAPTLSDAAKAELDTAMQRFLPGAPLTWMTGLGADAVAAELASDPDS